MLLACAVPLAAAKTVYIRDMLYVPLRTGQSEAYHILDKGLKSGTPLQLLQTNKETGYSQVRTQKGVVGWIQTQYVQDDPVARDQLQAATDKLAKLEAAHQQTLLHAQALQAQNDSLTKDLNDTRAKLDEVSKRYGHIQEMSANVIKISKRNAELQASELRLKAQIKALSESNRNLKGNAAQAWFTRGGALAIVAVLIGFLIARRIYTNRRSSGWV